MSKRLLAGLILALATVAAPATAQIETRSIERSQNSDYFGFDLRTVEDVTLDQCEAACLGDSQCRAFTYNTRVKWCFLKSDYNVLNRFDGAVAGKVVTTSDDPDIGAPPSLSFVRAWVKDEAVRYRAAVTSAKVPADRGLAGYVETAVSLATTGNDPRSAAGAFSAAMVISANARRPSALTCRPLQNSSASNACAAG